MCGFAGGAGLVLQAEACPSEGSQQGSPCWLRGYCEVKLLLRGKCFVAARLVPGKGPWGFPGCFPLGFVWEGS